MANTGLFDQTHINTDSLAVDRERRVQFNTTTVRCLSCEVGVGWEWDR